MNGRREIRAGTVLGPYVLGEPIGTGASAVVYAAQDAAGRRVAVKVRSRGQAEMDRRFLREFESMRLLRVKGVVQVHDAGFDDTVSWFAMDLVDGRPLQRKTFEGLSAVDRVARVAAIGVELFRILASLHEAGFVHRDIKPTNVLVDPSGGVHVLDFGIGRYFGDQDTLSNSGEVLGTVPYMSPEQLSGLPVDEKTDVFAAALMLHEAIAGRRERPESTVGWIPKICLERPRSLATLHREVPRGLSASIDAALSVDPRDRPPAREASAALQRVVSGGPCATWPEPPFVDPGEGWRVLEGCIGRAGQPAVWVVEGPAGSGRTRMAERLHRLALLQGIWTIHLHCRIDRVGGPILELLEVVLASVDDADLAPLLRPATPTLRRLWPHLPLPWEAPEEEGPESRPVVVLADLVGALIELRPMLLIVHDLERVDTLTARWLSLVAGHTGPVLGLLLLHEARWASPASRELVGQLRRERAAGVAVPPRMAPATAELLAASLVPEDPRWSPIGFDRPVEPRLAVEAGWRRLAEWRGERFQPPDPWLWPLAVLEAAVPHQVLRAVGGGDGRGSPWVCEHEDGTLELDGPTARTLVRPRATSLQRGAEALAVAWERLAGADPATELHARLATSWLLAQDPARAIGPAARAAAAEEALDRFAAARSWLAVLDSLPPPLHHDANDAFELAWVKARVALYTDGRTVKPALLETLGALVTNAPQEQRARLLGAEVQLRQGSPRTALVTALKVGSLATNVLQESTADRRIRAQIERFHVPALLLAVRCRIALRQLPEALRELERAETALGSDARGPVALRVSNVRAELALLQEDLLWCRALCQKNIRSAGQSGDVRGAAEASFRLGLVLRMLGRRREAEHHVRSAREAYTTTGDVSLGAETGLALATLLVERGEALPARHLLDQTIRAIRGLSMTNLLPVALRVALQVATSTDTSTDGSLALAELEALGHQDPETAAAMVHWWRSRGAFDRALAVPPPPETTDRSYGHVAWRMERARAAMAADAHELAAGEARLALDRATDRGFAELQTYAQLVLGTVTALDDADWAELQARSTTSMWTEVFLGALEMDARRLQRVDPVRARERWSTLRARARELGYRPGVEEATGWLAVEP